LRQKNTIKNNIIIMTINRFMFHVPQLYLKKNNSGKHTKSDIENGPVKIVDLPIYHPKKCDFPVRYVAVDQRVTTL
jgi:hypothetical protein